MAVSGAAPCQCLTLGGHSTTSPCRMILYRASPFLGQPDAERNEQGLAQRVGVPVGARTRLKGDVGTVDALWCLGFKSRINTDITCKILSGCCGRRAGTCRNHELSLGFSISRGHGHNPKK